MAGHVQGEIVRCFDGDEEMRAYHDFEWGRPIVDERGLYEKICLEAFQSGISWFIVLRKREALRAAFHDFLPDAVASFKSEDIDGLLANPHIIRNRTKIEAAITNARATLALRESGRTLPALVWSFRPESRSAPLMRSDVPVLSDASTKLAASLKGAGFRFVGPTTMHALMQAAGIVNDHLAACWVRDEVDVEQTAAAERFVSPPVSLSSGT